MPWDTDKWKQGYFVHIPEGLASFTQDGCRKYLVVSHDCDLSRPPDRDAIIEMIPCSPVVGNSDTKGKNPRLLRIECADEDFCLHADKKIILKKDDIPDSIFPQKILSDSQLSVLKNWLVARYKRQALPNTLDRLLSRIFKESFPKLAKKDVDVILGVWIRYDPEEELVNDDEKYDCKFYFVYDTEEENCLERAKAIVDKCTEKIKISTDCADKVDIDLIPIADSQFTYNMQRKLVQWYYDFISIQDEI